MTASAVFAAVRALHELAALIALGELVYVQAIAGAFDHRARRRVFALLVVSLLGAFGWLACEAANMSGLPLAEALARSVFAVVLEETLFGRVWTLRIVLGAALCVGLVVKWNDDGGQAGRATPGRHDPDPGRGHREAGLLLAFVALYVATLALTGHAVANSGAARAVHVAADGVHLLAAGAWLGALPGLAMAAATARRSATKSAVATAARATRRFSILGIVCVAALVVTGSVNAWFLVGSPLALIATPYGQWLLLKLAAVATMVAIAAYNRQRLAPRIEAGDATALGPLARNAWIELGLGVAVVAIVGHLGIAMPAIDERPMMPSFVAALQSPTIVSAADRAREVIDARTGRRAPAGPRSRP